MPSKLSSHYRGSCVTQSREPGLVQDCGKERKRSCIPKAFTVSYGQGLGFRVIQFPIIPCASSARAGASHNAADCYGAPGPASRTCQESCEYPCHPLLTPFFLRLFASFGTRRQKPGANPAPQSLSFQMVRVWGTIVTTLVAASVRAYESSNKRRVRARPSQRGLPDPNE